MTSIVISSGHGLHIRGASDILDEVDEARRVVDQVAQYMVRLGVDVVVFHDDVSTTQNENLNRIVDFHNSQPPHDLDVSVHFNCNEHTEDPLGTECLWVTEDVLAEDMAATISDAGGLLNRGPKYRDDLFFLNQTQERSILIETCFVDSEADAELYQTNFDEICRAIAEVLAGKDMDVEDDDEAPPPRSGRPTPPEISQPLVRLFGKVSWFGGPADEGVSPDEGLAFLYEVSDAPHLFLTEQPEGTTGLARRLNPAVPYIACRWDYDVTPKEMLRDQDLQAIVIAKKTGRRYLAFPADWGPHSDTDRIADLSPGLMEMLGIETDDEVEVYYPANIFS
jgi:N-acetylmuramoyl-L-alanine amidase